MSIHPEPGRRRIHEVAAELGLTTRSIRYYEQVGLLCPARSDGSYRLYDDGDVERLRAIVTMRDDAGFSLADIRELLSDEDAASRIGPLSGPPPTWTRDGVLSATRSAARSATWCCCAARSSVWRR